ncbi:MAG: oligosaccharide flippase family protein [Desulforhopalus sp.]
MNIKGQFAKGGAIIGVSQVTSQFCSLGRNVIIARLISPADFGIAAVFLLVVSLLEMISNLSLDRLLIQSPEGDDEKFQSVAHLLQAVRGVVNCGVLLILASPVATLFSIPEATGSFYVLAFIPLINGFLHFDTRRMERTLRFWPNASIEITSQIVMLILAWPIGEWFGDYRAMLCLLLLKTLIMVAGTHVIADRKYRWSNDRQYTKRFLSFGWPLLINGLLLFGILQGDKFILSSAKKLFNSTYDMSDVGLYSAAFMLAMMPAMIFGRVASLLFLPMLSKQQNSHRTFTAKARLYSQGLVVGVLAIGTLMLLTGDKLLPVVYGTQYRVEGGLVGWLSVMWAIRILRVLPATISMAKGNTTNLMYANTIRILFLAGVVFVVIQEMNMAWIAIVGITGEICAYLGSLYLNKKYLKIPLSISSHSDVLLTFGLLIAAMLNISVINNMSGTLWFISVCITSLVLPSLMLVFLPVARQKLASHYNARLL